MKATELINKFKQILTLSTEEVIEEGTPVEETVELTEEVATEVENVEVEETVELAEETEVQAEEELTEEVAEEAAGEVEESVEEVEEAEEAVEEVEESTPPTPEFELSKEDSEEVEEVTELAEETPESEEEIVEEIVETKEEIKYASVEELAGLKAEIKALTEMLEAMSPKKDVPQELSAEDIKEEQVEAEGISVSPEADVVEKSMPLAIKKGIRGASTKDVVWGKLFGNN